MKNKLIIMFAILCLTLYLSSCTKDSQKVYFIHAIGFDNAGKNIAMSAVTQKEGDEKNDDSSQEFEVLRFEAKTAKECFEKLLEFCKNTYFGTSETYFFSTGLTKDNLDDICIFIPFEPNLPSRSLACAVDGQSAADFLKNAKDKTFFEEIKIILNDQKVNIVSFLGKSFQGESTCLIPLVSYHDKVVNSGTVKCTNNYFEVR